MPRRLLQFMTALVLMSGLAPRGAAAAEIVWHDWGPGVFAEAKRDDKLVLLDLKAVWCHWCHVMEQTTYSDPAVIALLARHYVAVRVDQDSHPDLSRRYENWGWPATIALDAEGRELWRNRGYIEPAAFATTIEGIAEKPEPLAADSHRPLPAGTRDAALDPVIVASMERRFGFAFDAGVGGWGTVHKFIQADAIEHVLGPAAAGDPIALRMIRETMTGAVKIVDPVEGGIFQYSVRGWDEPHYEKIASSQGAALRLFAAAYAIEGETAWRDAARLVIRYVSTTFSDPSGAFYVSQDADPDAAAGITGKDYYGRDAAGRAAMAAPRLDRHLYASETGQIASGLAAAAASLDDADALARAEKAGDWLLSARRRADGSFAHDVDMDEGPYLPDTLYAAAAFVDLYAASGDRRWLTAAGDAASAMLATFATTDGGLASAKRDPAAAGPLARPYFHLDDNVAAGRLLLRLHHLNGDPALKTAAARLHAFLAHQPALGFASFWPGLLTLNEELAAEPLHVVVVGPRGDAATQGLFRAARALAQPHKRVELLDRAEGPLPNVKVEFPPLDRPAAFICTATTCSLPVFDVPELVPAVVRLSSPAE